MARGGRLGWFLGLVFGALFGVLFAPHKGKDLRERIKSDRKKGKLGIAPLSSDMKQLGQELADIALDIYYSKPVQDIVEVGRERIHGLSEDFVENVADFHVQRIKPLQKKARMRVKKAQDEMEDLSGKVESSAKIAKQAYRKIKGEFKKKI